MFFFKHKNTSYFFFVLGQISNYKTIQHPNSCSTLTHFYLEENILSIPPPRCLFLQVLSLMLSLFLSLSVCPPPIAFLSLCVQAQRVKQGRVRLFLWRRNKGHLQEVVCERAQNASRIIRSAVMTDNRPQLIRGKVRELWWCGGAKGKAKITRDYQSQCNESIVHLHYRYVRATL